MSLKIILITIISGAGIVSGVQINDSLETKDSPIQKENTYIEDTTPRVESIQEKTVYKETKDKNTAINNKKYTSIFQNKYNRIISEIPEYSGNMIEPYTDILDFDSKYQDDKSTINKEKYEELLKKRESISLFQSELAKNTDRFLINKNYDALGFIDAHLKSWAEAEAMEQEAITSNGKAIRKWFLGSVSSSLMKLESNSNYEISSEITDWLENIANKTYAEYKPRYEDDTFAYFNNHDLWASYGLISSAVITENTEHFNLALKILSKSFKKLSGDGQYAYWDIELARGELGASYMQYAMNAFTYTAFVAEVNGKEVLQYGTYQKLANFVKDIFEAPEKVEKYFSTSQENVKTSANLWAPVYFSQTGNTDFKNIANSANMYSTQLGGSLEFLKK